MKRNLSYLITVFFLLITGMVSAQKLDAVLTNLKYDSNQEAIVFDLEIKAGEGYVPGTAKGSVGAMNLKFDLFLEPGVTVILPRTTSCTLLGAPNVISVNYNPDDVIRASLNAPRPEGFTVVTIDFPIRCLGLSTYPENDFQPDRYTPVATVKIPVTSATKPGSGTYFRQRPTILDKDATADFPLWGRSFWGSPAGPIYNGFFENQPDFHLQEQGRGGVILTPRYSVANPQLYPDIMSFTSAIQLNREVLTSGNLEIGAFCGTECRGSVWLHNYPEVITYPYLGFLTVYGKNNNKEVITFKVYDHNAKKEYDADNFVAFVSEHYGEADIPYFIQIAEEIVQQIRLNNGWTWISSNVISEEISLLNQFKQSANNVKLLRGRNGFIQTPYWIGTLYEINNTDMYQIETSAARSLSFTGLPVKPAGTPIELQYGWNWIGYTAQRSLPIEEALTELNAREGDQIKSYSQVSFYTNGHWEGNLSTMNPGEGYMYYSTNAATRTFVYSSAMPSPELTSQLKNSSNDNELNLRWTTKIGRFANNMTIASVVLLGNDELQSDQIEVGAFCGNECRGSVLLKNNPRLTNHPYMGFLTVYGENDDAIRFRVYNHATGEEYEAGNVLSFDSNTIYGTPVEPFEIRSSPTGISNTETEFISVYTDAAGKKLYIKRPWNSIDRLEIVDLNGHIILQETDFISESVQISSLVQGVYILKLFKENQASVHKFIKK